MRKKPFINASSDLTVGICTFNSAELLSTCLNLLFKQSNANIKEVIVADGGSSDGTLSLCKNYGAKVVFNKKRLNRHGKQLLINHTSTEFLCLLDSDNFLLDKNYLAKMSALIRKNPNCIGVDSLMYSVDDSANWIDRYLASIGADDPLASLLGYFDRHSTFENAWTGVPDLTIAETNDGDFFFRYLQCHPKNLVPVGANGSIIRVPTFKRHLIKTNADGFEHVLHSNEILIQAQHKNFVWGKVNTGLMHKHGLTLEVFFKKKMRRYLRESSSRAFIPSRIFVLRRIMKFIFDFIFSRAPFRLKIIHLIMISTSIMFYLVVKLKSLRTTFREENLDV